MNQQIYNGDQGHKYVIKEVIACKHNKHRGMMYVCYWHAANWTQLASKSIDCGQ